MYRWASSRLLAAILTLAVTLAGAVGFLIVREHQQSAAAAEARVAAAEQAREAWEQDLAQAEKEEAEREQIAQENAAVREQAQKTATKKRLAEERAARAEAARVKAEREKAAAERAERLAEQKRLATEKKKRYVLQGRVLVPEVNGALVPHAGGRPGQPVRTLSESQRKRFDTLLESVQRGKTYRCTRGAGGRWTDLASGAQVTVEDGEGKVLSKGTLTGGTLSAEGCSFSFAIEVGYADYYRVRVTQRGPGTWSRDEMVSQGWSVALTL